MDALKVTTTAVGCMWMPKRFTDTTFGDWTS
jgi:hypothetical protein